MNIPENHPLRAQVDAANRVVTDLRAELSACDKMLEDARAEKEHAHKTGDYAGADIVRSLMLDLYESRYLLAELRIPAAEKKASKLRADATA